MLADNKNVIEVDVFCFLLFDRGRRELTKICVPYLMFVMPTFQFIEKGVIRIFLGLYKNGWYTH